MPNRYVLNLKKTIEFANPGYVPVVIWGGAPFSTTLVGIREIDYYKSIENKLKTFVTMFEKFPEAVFVPGFWPDFGATTVPSAFGSEVVWQDREAPYAKPCLKSAEDIDRLKPVDPKTSGLMKTCLREWEYYWKHVDRKWIEEYEYLDGVAFAMGPVESAAQMRGYTPFFLEIMEYPEKIAKLLDIVTETEIAYLREQEKINGRLKKVFIGDHLATQISPAHCREFYTPYIRRIFDAFPYAEIRAWHNEGACKHILDQIPEFNCNVWHFGNDPAGPSQKSLKRQVVPMGNIHTVDVLLNGSPENVAEATAALLDEIDPNEAFIVSSGGGMAPKTSCENVRAMIDTVFRFNRKGPAGNS
jgi:uroporphyrinogen decarboxylase